jgi:hypothetical protein
VGFFFGFKSMDALGKRESGPLKAELTLHLREFFGVVEGDVTFSNDLGPRVSGFDQLVHGDTIQEMTATARRDGESFLRSAE